jgi:rhomboid family GlyGly-CTERM serine protease
VSERTSFRHMALAWWNHWRLPVIVSVVVVVFQWGGWSGPLRYDASATSHGQVWRLLTGNLVHLSWVHLFRDVPAMFVIWFGFSHVLSERGWILLLVLDGLAVTLGLYFFAPSVEWYVGLSGVLYGLVMCAGLLLLPTRPVLGSIMVVGSSVIVLYGVFVGPLPIQELHLGGKVIPQAHLFGLIGGALFALGSHMLASWRGDSLAGAAREGNNTRADLDQNH